MSDVTVLPMVYTVHDDKLVNVQVALGPGSVSAGISGGMFLGTGVNILANGIYFDYLRLDSLGGDPLHVTTVDFLDSAGHPYDASSPTVSDHEYRVDVTYGGPLQSRILVGQLGITGDDLEIDYFANYGFSSQACYLDPNGGGACQFPTAITEIAAAPNTHYLAVAVHWANSIDVELVIDTFYFYITGALPTPGAFPPLSAVW